MRFSTFTLLFSALLCAIPQARAEDMAAEAARVGRAATLASPRSRKAVMELIPMLSDPSPNVRAKACLSLGLQGHDKPVQAIIKLLDSDPEVKVRVAAATALGQIQNNDSAAMLKQKLASDPDENVRAACAIALGRLLDGKDVFKPLAAALKDKSDAVRLAVAQALGYEQGYAAGRLLTFLVLLDKNPDIRAAAATSLAMCCSYVDHRITVDETLANPWYYWDPFWDPLPVETVEVKIGKLDTKGLQSILKTLLYVLSNDSDSRARAGAAKGLGKTGSDAAVEPLIQALSSDPNPQVRAEAASGLGHLGAKRALDALTAAKKDSDPDVSMEASLAFDTILRKN